MKKPLVMLGVLFSIVFANSSFAGPGTWTPAKAIQNIIIEGSSASGRATVVMVGGIESVYMKSTCFSRYLTIDLESVMGRSMLALVLSAKASGATISFSMPSCVGSRPLVSLVRI